MVVFPHCKINLGLRILRRRADGYHDLETVFYPVPWHDVLEAVQADDNGTDISFTASGLLVQGVPDDNLCVKAYRLLRQHHPELPPVTMHLHKVIPTGAGLGGGSADAAFALDLLNRKFRLGLSTDTLATYALQLGSDCPFFLHAGPAYATGRGEVLERVALDLSTYRLVVVNPGIHVPTGWAFSQVTPGDNRPSLKEAIEAPVSTWQQSIKNDFEPAVFARHPEVQACKEALYAAGAVYASMTGSGSTVFGLFAQEAEPVLSFPHTYLVKTV